MIRYLVLALMSVTLTGCFAVSEEIIPVASSASPPNIVGNYKTKAGATLKISTAKGMNHFRFKISSPRGDETGTFRSMHIEDTTYLVQVKFDNTPLYLISHFYYDQRQVHMAVVDITYTKLHQLTNKHGIKLHEGFDYDELEGDPSRILAFMMGYLNTLKNPATSKAEANILEGVYYRI